MPENYYGIPGGGDPNYQGGPMYEGQPGGGNPNYRGGTQYKGKPGGGRKMDERLWSLWQDQGGSNPGVDYNSTLGRGDPGGRNKNIGYGFGGEMTTYDSTPMYQALTGQIDEQTSAEMDKLREEFGDAGMRWSTPLMGAQADTLRKAAGDKNRLLTDLKYKDFENAWGRQTKESDALYGRGRDEEQEGYGRDKYGDAFGWERAKYGAEWDRDKGDKSFERLFQLDDAAYDRARGEEENEYQRWQSGDESAYGRWQDAYNRRQQMEQEKYGRWLTEDQMDYGRWEDNYGRRRDTEETGYDRWARQDQNDFDRSQAASEFDLRMGGMQNDYDRQMMMDLWGMGGDERGWANQDLMAQYQEWLRQTQGYDQDIQGLLGQLMGGGGAPIQGEEDIDWAQWAQVLATLAD